MYISKDIKIIRALWGDSKLVLNEVPERPLYNEYVYVWGIDNYRLLIERGYEAELVDTFHTPFPSKYHTFFNKLVIFKKAIEKFNRILFLDWDCTQIKSIDREFWQWFEGKSYAAPLYCYPLDLKNHISGMDDEQKKWMHLQIPMLDKYSWKHDNLFVLPNACMVYLSDLSLCIKMIEHYRKYNMSTVEEFAMFSSLECSLEYYLKNYEIPFVFGRPDQDYFSLGDLNGDFSRQLNSFIKTNTDKDIYFEHI